MKLILNLSIILFLFIVIFVFSAEFAPAEVKEDFSRCIVAYKADELDVNTALKYCTRAIQSGKLSGIALAESYYVRGYTYSYQGNLDNAITDLGNAITLAPDDYDGWYELGRAHRKNRDFEKAIQAFDRAIKLRPKSAESYNNRGLAYRGLEKYSQAIRDYDKAIRLSEFDDEKAMIYSNRGVAYDKTGKHLKAMQDHDEAIRLDPGNGTSYSNRGYTYREMGNQTEAMKNWKRAYELGNRSESMVAKLKAAGAVDSSGRLDPDWSPADKKNKELFYTPTVIKKKRAKPKIMETAKKPQAKEEGPISAATGGKWGKRHPSWSESDVKSFLGSIFKAMELGGKTLQQKGWQGTWNRGSRSYDGQGSVRLEYRTKAEFAHDQTNGSSDIVEIYFWQYHSAKRARAQVDQIVQNLKNIHKQSDKYARLRFKRDRDMGLGNNSHAISYTVTDPKGKSRNTTKLLCVLSSNTWNILINHSRAEITAPTVLSALYDGFNQQGIFD